MKEAPAEADAPAEEEAPVEGEVPAEEAPAEEEDEPILTLTGEGAVELTEKAAEEEAAAEVAEDDAALAAEAEERQELLAGMIDSAVEARKTEGIYAALDNALRHRS